MATVKKLIKIKPLFNKVVTTMNTYEEDQYHNGIIDSRKAKGSLKEYQTVVGVGDMVKSIKEGDVVAINPTRYAVMKHKAGSMNDGVIQDNAVLGYKFNTITLDGKEHLMLYDSDIDFIVVESADEEMAGPTIIQKEKPKIIV